MSEPHKVKVAHDAASHDFGCHDDCEVEIICPGVTDSCRCWQECEDCRKARTRVDLEAFDERLREAGEAHGIDHEWIDGVWMTPTRACVTAALESDAGDLVYTLPEGLHPISVDCEDDFVHVSLIDAADALDAEARS